MENGCVLWWRERERKEMQRNRITFYFIHKPHSLPFLFFCRLFCYRLMSEFNLVRNTFSYRVESITLPNDTLDTRLIQRKNCISTPIHYLNKKKRPKVAIQSCEIKGKYFAYIFVRCYVLRQNDMVESCFWIDIILY